MTTVKLHDLDEGEFTSTYNDFSTDSHVVCIPYSVETVTFDAGTFFGSHNLYNEIFISDYLGRERNYELLETIVGEELLGDIDFMGSLSFKILLVKGGAAPARLQHRLTNLKAAVGYDVAVVFGANLNGAEWGEWRNRRGLLGLETFELKKLHMGRITTIIYDKDKIKVREYPVIDGYKRYRFSRVNHEGLIHDLVDKFA